MHYYSLDVTNVKFHPSLSGLSSNQISRLSLHVSTPVALQCVSLPKCYPSILTKVSG